MIKLAKDIYHAMKERHAKLLEYAGRIGYNAVVAFHAGAINLVLLSIQMATASPQKRVR